VSNFGVVALYNRGLLHKRVRSGNPYKSKRLYNTRTHRTANKK